MCGSADSHCPTGYLPTRFDYDAACGSAFSNTKATYARPTATTVSACGTATSHCPTGYYPTRLDYNASCGSSFSNTTATCSQRLLNWGRQARRRSI